MNDDNLPKYNDAYKASVDIFTNLFGEEKLKELESVEYSEFDYGGYDVEDCYEITATFPNIKERFNPTWTKYFKEKDTSAFEAFVQAVFHLGYYSGYVYEKRHTDFWKENAQSFMEIIKESRNNKTK